MKTFKDLEFTPDPLGEYIKNCEGAKMAKMYFDNGYGIMVLFGKPFHSNNLDTYECHILEEGKKTFLFYAEFRNLTEDEVTQLMEKLQTLNK